ncbi:MAG: hypothetical protein K0R28_5945, partial [Paenibacillus sp.]|nr:hypothetical protein [Paenibacillus sp.]
MMLINGDFYETLGVTVVGANPVKLDGYFSSRFSYDDV